MRTSTLIFCLCPLLLSVAGEGRTEEAERPFRRIVFEEKVPLGEEAPFIATRGHLLAFGSGHEILVIDVRTGETIHKRSVVPGEAKRSLSHEARVLGIADGTVYACVRHFTDPDRLDPAGDEAVIAGGPEPGSHELVAFNIDDPEVRQIGPLLNTARIADGLLGTSLVYTEGRTLQVVPLAGGDPPRGGESQSFILPGDPVRRPVVKGGEVLGRYEGGAYVYCPGRPALKLIPFRDTPLEPLRAEDHIEKAGDLLVASVRGEIVACDLSGRLRWRFPVTGRAAAGPDREICVLASGVGWGWGGIWRLSRGDGHVIWRAYFPPTRWYHNDNRLRDASVLGGRLVVFAEKDMRVYDVETGRLLMNMPQNRDLVRGSYHIYSVLSRMELAGDVLVVGFEDRVFGVDLTPTAKIPARYQASDPANAAPELAFLAKLPEGSGRSIWKLAEIGRNMADTPEAAVEVLPLVKKLLWKKDGSPEELLVFGFQWLDDKVIFRAMEHYVRMEKVDDWKRASVLEMLSCRPERKEVSRFLREVVRDAAKHPARVRKAAAVRLRLLGEMPSPALADLKLLYSRDHEAATAEFRRRLRDGDAKVRAAALKLLGMAPDVVIVALEPEFAKLPEGKQAEGSKLVGEAKARLGAIADFDDRD